MSAERTYLDHNATAPLRPEARSAVVAALDAVGNPSSVHAEGRRARAIVEEAREKVAALVGAQPAQVVFTSGATEANAWVAGAGWDAIFVSGIEHDSILAPARLSAARKFDVPATAGGVIDVEKIATCLASVRTDHGLVTVQLANNETGIIQPLAEVSGLARDHALSVHSDAVQAVGRIATDFAALGIDCLSLSSHKIGGPKGVGALVIRDGFEIAPLIAGGGQERRRRAGTENVPGIAGFGAAAAAAKRDLADMPRISALRDRLEQEALAIAPGAIVIGQRSARLANTMCIALPGVAAETLVIRLDLAGVAVSAGAACSSGKVGASTVLAAMGLPADIARSAIRVSLGWNTTSADIDMFVSAWAAIAGPASRQRAVA